MSTSQRKNGKWEARISWYDSFGHRHQKVKGGFNTKTEASIGEAKLRLEYESEDSKLHADKQETFADYFEHWYMFYKKPKLSHVTLKHYKYVHNVIQKYFGNILLKNVNRSMYQKFIVNFGQNHAPATMKKINNIIRPCVKNAVYDGAIMKDFTYNIELVANKSNTLQVDYLNISEIKKLLQHVIDNLDPNFTSNYMIATAILTGARISEIAALTWDDINFNFQTITINKSYDYDNRTFKPTKNESSNRIIRINKTLCEILRTLKKRSNPDNLIFWNRRNTIPTSNAVNKALRAQLEELGINRRNFHFHSLRHSHVAYLLANGVDIYPISKRLGHSNISMTTRAYAYLIDEYKEKNDQIIIDELDKLTINNANQNANQISKITDNSI